MSSRGENLGPAVQDGQLRFTSVSALNRFLLCQRAWWFRYVAGLPDKPPSKGQERGVAGHKRIETYLRTGLDVLDPLERLALPHLPKPGGDLLIEHPLHARGSAQLLADGLPVVGYVDLVNPRLLPGTVTITDWKFSKDVERYGAREADLVDTRKPAGVQMVGYAAWATGAFAELRDVVVAHGEFQTQGRPSFRTTSAILGVDSALEKWEGLCGATIPQMRSAARESSHLAVLPTFESCGAYGGCAYRGRCRDPGDRLAQSLFGSPKEEVNVGMIRKENNPPVSNPSPVVGQSSGAIGISSPNGTVSDNNIGRTWVRPAEQSVAPAGPPIGALGIVPPDVPISPAVTAAPVAPAQQAEASAPVAAAGDVPARRRRVKTVVEDVQRPPAVVPPPADPGMTQRDVAPPSGGVHLYLGCSPVGIATQTLHAYVCELEGVLREKLKATWHDVRVAQDEGLKFNKWKAYLAGMVPERLPSPGHYIGTLGDERVECVADALCAVLPPGAVVRS